MKFKKLALIAILTLVAGYTGYYLYQRSRQVDLIIHNGIIITMDQNLKQEDQVIAKGAVAIRGDKIVAVSTSDVITKKYKAKELIDAKGNAVLPGFINGHTHAAMTLLRGVADDHALDDWLHNYIFPLEKELVNEDFVYWGTKLACLELISGGVTTAADMYFYEDTAARAFVEMGMRAVAGYAIFKQSDVDSLVPFIKKWRSHPLITPAIAPHAPHTTTQDVLVNSNKVSEQYNVPIMIHLAETQHEFDLIQKQHQLTPVAYLNKIGLLNNRLIAAHCVKVNDDDIQLLKQQGAGAIHNPFSNMKLASGVAPVQKMIEAGVHVGLGTDGAASNNSLDLLAEMQISALLQKVTTSNPRALNAYQALSLATISGARAIHQAKTIGSLEVGKKADIIIVNIHQYHTIPLYNVISQLVYTSKSSDVETVIINGKLVMHASKLLYPQAQIDAIKQNVERYQKKVMTFLKKPKAATPSQSWHST